MNEIVTVRQHSQKNSTLLINKQLADRMNFLQKKRGVISFGARRNYVSISVSHEVPRNEILLPAEVIDDLHIPDYITLEAYSVGNEIKLGPCIGILTSQRGEDITRRRLREISLNTLDYSTVHGAIILFTLDKVNPSDCLIQGYCFNPKSGSWEKGIFPYPLAIYSRITLNEKWQNHFLSMIGDTVFNNIHFNKWDMYQWFSSENDISPYLPYTRLYRDINDIYDMLQKYEKVYVKPIWGMKGIGVTRVSMKDGKLVCHYREDEENKTIIIDNSKDGAKASASLFKPGEYIIQEGLDLLTYKDGVVDFRVVMQKNASSHWVCNAIVSRAGVKQSVVSNISSGGMAVPAAELFKEVLGLSGAQSFMMREKMVQLCMKVCEALDRYGLNYGTLGLDLGLDKHGRIWLIEVNNRRPHPAIALRVNDLQAYYTILSSPLYYAKSLAGF